MKHIERNYQLVKQRMIEQMENSIKLGRRLIDTELDTGLLNFIIKPIVKTFYDYWSKNDAREGTLKQINITLEAGKKLLLNGGSNEIFNEILNDFFPKYLESDQTTRQCSRDHKNYEKLKNVTKQTFINYLKELVKLLDIKVEVGNYGDLCREAFPSKEVAKQNLMKQLDFTDQSIKIVEEDPNILKLPVGKKIILKALRKGFEQTKEEFTKAINDTYNNI
ncbi:MAG: hypothetical protein ACFFDY_06270 [Candidatus Thorarchaeota archaeon]